MFIDIVIPRNNETQLIAMAERLGIQGLCFLYKNSQQLEEGKIKIFSGTFQKANGLLIACLKNSNIVFDPEIPEQLPQDGVAGISLSSVSSINPTKLKNAAKNIKLCRKGKLKVVAASFATRPFELRSEHDFSSLLVCLGMTPGEAKKALSTSAEILGCQSVL